MSGISMSYDLSVHIPVIYLAYDTNLFPTKLMSLSHQVGIWHPSKLPIHTMSLYIRGDYFLKRYTLLKMAVVSDKYKPNICLVYGNYMPRFLCFSINCVFNEEIITKLPRQV